MFDLENIQKCIAPPIFEISECNLADLWGITMCTRVPILVDLTISGHVLYAKMWFFAPKLKWRFLKNCTWKFEKKSMSSYKSILVTSFESLKEFYCGEPGHFWGWTSCQKNGGLAPTFFVGGPLETEPQILKCKVGVESGYPINFTRSKNSEGWRSYWGSKLKKQSLIAPPSGEISKWRHVQKTQKIDIFDVWKYYWGSISGTVSKLEI